MSKKGQQEHRQTYTDQRDKRFFHTTQEALRDIDERLMHLPQDQRYAGAYGVLRGYFENLLVNFAEAFSEQQLAEIRIVLDQLQAATWEDYYIPEAERAHLAELAQALREMEQQE